MKCCNNEKPQNSSKHNHMSHMWMMVLCCGSPVLLILLVSLLGSRIPGIKGYILGIVPFLCPLMMVFMMPMMLKGNKDKDEK